ncbi:hypothetical protein BpHYR1_033189 [Brachionus plicatilis]|uniref:Uncharacterized protein n=1 Tax=Brachionus plicatilis TaxID=10195 RepID=A0A3M7QD55_BRAPC|nr:hypothetical protein BpHYR1_033189 [Brachionus plicatilis]
MSDLKEKLLLNLTLTKVDQILLSLVHILLELIHFLYINLFSTWLKGGTQVHSILPNFGKVDIFIFFSIINLRITGSYFNQDRINNKKHKINRHPSYNPGTYSSNKLL